MTAITAPQAEPFEHHTEHPHVVQVKGVPIVRGTRLPVRLIAQMYRAGDTVEDILQTYPHLHPAAAHDAISYYLDHRGELEQEIAARHIEQVLARAGARMDERGFIMFAPPTSNG